MQPRATRRRITLYRDGAPREAAPGVIVRPAYAWMLEQQVASDPG